MLSGNIRSSYALALHICGKVLQEAPDEHFLAQVYEQQLFTLWPLKAASKEAADALAELVKEYSTGVGDIAALRQDHLLLFSGPAPLARPWESVWREKDALLFGEQTTLVRKCYAEWGLAVNNFGHVPEDHIGLEIAYCVHLLHQMTADAENSTRALSSFLDGHLLQWAEPCLHKASECAIQTFYRCVPLLCLDALHALRSSLNSTQKNK